MKNLFTNLMKNTAKRTQNTGGGTSHEKNSAVAVWNDSRTTVNRRSTDGQSQRRYNVSLWKYAAMILMVLCLGTGQMWADYTWDFTEMSSADKTAYDALTSAWTWNKSNSRYDNAFTPTNGTWTDVISTTITQIKDMKFMRTGSNMGTGSIRIFPNTSGNKDGRLAYNNSNVAFSIPAEKDDEIKITFSNTNSSAQGYVLTNAKRKSDNATTITVAQNTTTTDTLVVTASGRVEFKCNNSKVILYKLVLTSAASCDAAPTAPSAFAKSSVTSTTATFSITDAGNAASYDIYTSTSSTAPEGGTTPTATGLTTKTPTVTSLTAGTTYYAWVRAVCDGSHKSSWVALGTPTFTTLAAPTASFSNSTYAIGGSALDLSSLWSSNSAGSVTYSVEDAAGTGASVSTAAFSATRAGKAKVKAVQAANGSYDAITKYAYITVGSNATGKHTVTYDLEVNVNKSFIPHTDSVRSTSLRLTLAEGDTLKGAGDLNYSGTAKSDLTGKIEALASYDADKYVYVQFSIASGYTFTLDSAWCVVQAVGDGKNQNGKLVISDTDSHSFTGSVISCPGTKDGTPTHVVVKGDGSTAFTGTVTLKIYVYGTAATYRLGEKINIHGSVAASASCTTSPTVTAGSNSSVTATTATVSCASGISSLGSAGCSISSYGFVLNTSTGPTLSNTTHAVGTTYTTTNVSFEKALTGLTAGTTYYVRPYATNGNGTSYGTETSFTTLPSTPTFSPTSGSTVSGSQKITITGHSGSTVYYAWATSSLSADNIYNSGSGSHGTTDAGTASVDVVDGKTLYAISRLSSTNSAVASASYTVDNTAPTLSSSTPADDATDIDASGNIVLTFSENVTINDASKFSLTGGSGTLSTGSATASGTTVTIPYSGLDNNTTYTFSSDAGAVKDEAGNTSAELSDISFTTANVTYTVTYSKGSATGGTAPTDATSYSSGAKVTVKDTTGCKFVYAGYTFRGWTDGTTFYKEGQKFTISGNTTLTAVWDGAGSSVTLTHFGTQFRTSAPRRGFAYAGSLSGTKYIIESDDSNTKNADNDSSAIRLHYSGKYLKVLGPGATTTLSDSLFSGVTQVSFKWKYIASTTTYTTGIDVYVGSTKVETKSLTGNKNDDYATATISNIASKNGTVKLVNTGTSTSNQKFNFDDITITCGVLPTGKTVTFACGSTAPSTSVSGMPGKIEGITSGLKIVKPADPSASGYIFGGWYSNAACTAGNEIDWSTTITADKTIYAKWTAKTSPGSGTVSGTTSICSGSNTDITLSASVLGASYKLYKDGDEVADSEKAGTGSALTWNVSAAGTYTVSAVETETHASGDMSGSATISIYTALSLTASPKTPRSAGVGVGCALTGLTTTGNANVAYKWQVCDKDDASGTNTDITSGSQYADYTTATMTFTPASSGTYYFRCVVSDDCGDSYNSSVVTVVAKVAPTVYELSGTTSICEGGTTDITLEDSQTGVVYKLLKGGVDQKDNKTGDGEALIWTVSDVGTYTIQTKEDATYAEVDMSGEAEISYYAATSIDTDPATAVTGHDGVNFTLGSDLDATGEGTLTYQWYSYSNSSGDNETTVGSATTTKTLTTSKSAGTYYYKVKVIGECGDEKSNMITVTVDNKHKLTYDANGGSGAPEAEFRAAGTAALSATEPTRTNYRFLGWNTEDDGTGDHYDAGASYTMGSSAVTLHAEWGETATLTWSPNVNTAESSIGTTSKGSTNARIDKDDDMANITNYGSLTITSSAKDNLTSKIETPATYTAGKYMYVTFDMPDNYEFVPTSISVKVQPVGDKEDKYTILDISDENSHSLRSTATKCDGTSSGTLTTVTLEGDETALTGTVTLKIYVYNYSGESTTNNCYRLGSPITIAGNVNYVCPERATITSPTTAQSIKLYTDQSKTLSVSATAYAGTLNYQWQKNGVDIDDATSATYTVVGSGLTAGTTYKYTCNVSETSPASCATVTSPAFNITAASPDCGYTEIASAVLTSASAATPTGCTARVSLGGKDDGDPEGCYKMTGKNKFFALILSQAFQVGDSIFFKLFTKTNIAAINIHATGDNDTIGTLIHSRTLVSGDYGKDTIIGFVVTPEMATTLNTNKKVAIFRNNTDNKQNHCLYWIKVKRYGCPDIFIYDDAAETSEWSDEDNWIGPAGHGSGLPTIDDRIVINKPMTVDVDDAQAAEIILDQSGVGKAGKLTIGAGKALVVAGTIKTYDGSSYSATTPSDIVLESDGTHGTGALITGEQSTTTQAGVQFYSKARYESGYVNQFIGVPLSSMTAYNGFYGTSLRVYDDANDKWQVLGNNAAMYPFTAYNLMRKETSAGTLYMEGALNLPGTGGKQELTITRRTSEVGSSRSDHLFANSWTAPIDIASMEEDDFDGADATIYIFNAGTTSDYATNGGNYTTKKSSYAGQWLYMPVEAVKETPSDFSLTVIPSMQAFMVHCAADNLSEAGGTTHTLTLDYKKHVYDPAKTSGAAIVANRAPRREASEAKHEIIRVRVEGTSGYADDLLLFIGDDFSNGYDNGWEAYKVSGKAYTPQLYAVTEDGRKAISAQPDADNTVIGFKAGTEDDVYTFTLDYEGNDASLYLHDTYTDDYVRVEKDATYTFLTTDNTDHPRFVLTRFNAPQVTTGVDDVQWNGSKARKLMIDGILYIIRDGRIYNAEGALVK